ncbi:meiotically up-regulated gene 184 protein-like [Durio zibethinus]|uniref:Meiotically up-regulated gene 184 protein-like n=1 Tax=Durio zibethinus TaxID=66656 RepID=A0A6P5WJF3_DURZI|nr:meiotically up-regulated gene 184 protein-like [Durio zibethinus]
MDCNKDEAIRAKELAEKKLAELDAAGAKRFALKAQNLYPQLDGLSQLLATLDIYIFADKKMNGEVDWYRVLGVHPYADEDTIRKHYRKLALILHPDKNKSVGADGAFKILSEAWNLLSNKAKRLAYDQKLRGIYTNVLNGQSSSSTVKTSRNGFHNFFNGNTSNTSYQNGATYSKPAPPHSERTDTFWTTCNSCKMRYEYYRVYVNLNLPCVFCGMLFLAVETPDPPINGSSKYIPMSAFMQQQRFHQAHDTRGWRFSGLHSSTKNFQKDAFHKSGSNINVAPAASFTAQAVGVNHSASETLKSRHKESQTGTMREESLLKKFHPSQKTDAGLSTGSTGSVSSFAAKKHRPKKRHRDERGKGNHMPVVNERASTSSFQKNGFETGRMNIAGISRSNSVREPSQEEIRNMLMQMARKHISKLNSSNPASLSNPSNKPKSFDKGMDEKDKGNGKDALRMKFDENKSMEFVDIKSSIQPKESYTVHSDVVSVTDATEELVPRAMNVPDPDFYDFDKDRTEKSFGGNQVWAAYDDDDGMPRYYAMIHSVISLKPFKMRMSWLNSKSNLELAPLNWIDSGFYKTSGNFWIGKHKVNMSLNSFSHKVKWSKGRKGAIQIYPRKGDVWALYRNWSSDWNELTADEVIHKYDMVQVLEDYNEQKGVAVAPLVKVPGFKTVFQMQSEPSKTWMIPRKELFRFSHQVPSHLITGQEGLNAPPKGCLELDPAAIPLELLQVLTEAQVKEMKEINERTQEETVSVDLKRSKGKEQMENDLKMKPNISAEGVEQAIMEQEIKEEKEKKKPGMLVYRRRQQRKQES